jgi:hypothetical protein
MVVGDIGPPLILIGHVTECAGSPNAQHPGVGGHHLREDHISHPHG